MDPITASTTTADTAITAGFLDSLAEARDAGEALRLIDQRRLQLAPGSIFSIQQNVTTGRDAAGEVLLRRFYSSEAATFPVNGAKRKTHTPWSECLFVRGRVFVGEGEHVLARNFDDFEQMRDYRLRSVINVPLMQGNLCYATFNVFGIRERWLPEELLGIRLLALAAARWVPSVTGLAYSLEGTPCL
ncbi:GAF domain-containing protein [Variovorax sp. W6]|uniref:GAF domain-containing protein n=1 Tax=Variovorax sp. W6 TaxID=3093895 RepID=UPI003D8074AB